MKLITPTHWRLLDVAVDDRRNARKPLVSLINDRDHQFHVHPIDDRHVRIVHTLPKSERGPYGRLGGVPMRNHSRSKFDAAGTDGIHWERRTTPWGAQVDKEAQTIKLAPLHTDADSQSTSSVTPAAGVRIQVDYSATIRLKWTWQDDKKEGDAERQEEFLFLEDFKNAYKYDARTKRVFHVVCRDQSYMPTTEHARPANENHIANADRFEYVYGLGECKGPMMKDGKRYVIEARDSLAADPQDTDPLYKVTPFYLHYNHKTRFWFGLYYNTLVPSVFDFSGEHDFATGQFRSFSAERGPLDYYLLLGEGAPKPSSVASSSSVHPQPASIVTQLARLVTPAFYGPVGRRQGRQGWQASPCLPPHNQFGYLASSLTISERPDAQQAVIDYVKEARLNGFPIDSMHLSSGYCVDAKTGERKYFYWDKEKYPDPAHFGRTLEKELHCKVIINVKPWLLETHPYYQESAEQGAFIRAAEDARPFTSQKSQSISTKPSDEDRCAAFATFPSRTLHWARGMGDTAPGSYIDFSSSAGADKWVDMINRGVLANGITGIWDDNNEFSSVIDDDDEVRGQVEMWSIPELPPTWQVSNRSESQEQARQVSKRMGWGKRKIAIGAVGPATQTMGMARATFAALLTAQPDARPVTVTRSAVPGVQAFAHSTWSGDNSTTWLSLKWSTKLSLSVGLSFGLGLYGHDIGGFAGQHSPSAELLVRWCQQSMWMTRFTIHSWKPTSTTPWMFDESHTKILRDIIGLRYQLLPTLYSLYVTQYHRNAWPVVRPLLWHFSRHLESLAQDEQYLVGSHVLVAPICDAGKTDTTFFLPHLLDEDSLTGDPKGNDDVCWYEMDTGRIHRPKVEGNQVTIDAPLHRCPTLIREGGVYILGAKVDSHIPSPSPHDHKYVAHIFPTPTDVLKERKEATPSQSIYSKGDFTLIEDDGVTNDASAHGRFTELRLYFEQEFEGEEDFVDVGVEVVECKHAGRWEIEFALPNGERDGDREVQVTSHPSHSTWPSEKVKVHIPYDRPGVIVVEVLD